MASASEENKTGSTKPIGGRATSEQVRIIDLAATLKGTTRGEYLVEKAYRAAVGDIEQAAPQLLNLKTA